MSPCALQYLIESLEDLDRQLRKQKGRLYIFYGAPEDVVEQLVRDVHAGAVYVNTDYTPFSIKRDTAIERACANAGASFTSLHDALLTVPGSITTTENMPFQVFTPFFKSASAIDIPEPCSNELTNFYNGRVAFEKPRSFLDDVLKERSDQIFIHGGLEAAQERLRRLSSLSNYDEDRNFPAQRGTTGLSACTKFGVVSIREVYHAIFSTLGREHGLIRELYWRDFFTHLAFFNPDVFGSEFHAKYRGLPWSHNETQFEAWCKGRTGFPIVDAGMRQLNQTGYIHNRVRMIAASFLTKDLHIDWRWGERYFAQKLIDYDPCVNNGNWQWAASTGANAQPYFRIFNPWSQQVKFDPEAEYIHQWIEELRGFPAEDIHSMAKKPDAERGDYPAPIVHHQTEAARSKRHFQY